jgi:transcription antitermination factor NusG
MISQPKSEPVKDAVKDHLKKIELPPRKHKSLPAGYEWLAFSTHPGKEWMAEYHLSRMGRTVFLPIEIKKRRVSHHAKRMREFELPLLTRCLFVGFEPGLPKLWQDICHLSLIQGVIAAWGADGMLRPVSITEAQMYVMLGRIGDMVHTNPRRSFGLGDLVRIKDGPFAGFFSKVQGIKSQSARLELHILGSSRGVDIPLEQLEAA